MCMEDIQHQIRVSRTMSEGFEVTKGLKHEDSLFHTLFIIALEKAVREMQWE